MTMQMMEVRCCCMPQKLLGWLPTPEGGQATFHVYRLERRPYSYWEAASLPISLLTIQMRVEEFYSGPDARPYPALKAEGVSIEALRMVPGFRENR